MCTIKTKRWKNRAEHQKAMDNMMHGGAFPPGLMNPEQAFRYRQSTVCSCPVLLDETAENETLEPVDPLALVRQNSK